MSLNTNPISIKKRKKCSINGRFLGTNFFILVRNGSTRNRWPALVKSRHCWARFFDPIRYTWKKKSSMRTLILYYKRNYAIQGGIEPLQEPDLCPKLETFRDTWFKFKFFTYLFWVDLSSLWNLLISFFIWSFFLPNS